MNLKPGVEKVEMKIQMYRIIIYICTKPWSGACGGGRCNNIYNIFFPRRLAHMSSLVKTDAPRRWPQRPGPNQPLGTCTETHKVGREGGNGKIERVRKEMWPFISKRISQGPLAQACSVGGQARPKVERPLYPRLL